MNKKQRARTTALWNDLVSAITYRSMQRSEFPEDGVDIGDIQSRPQLSSGDWINYKSQLVFSFSQEAIDAACRVIAENSKIQLMIHAASRDWWTQEVLECAALNTIERFSAEQHRPVPSTAEKSFEQRRDDLLDRVTVVIRSLRLTTWDGAARTFGDSMVAGRVGSDFEAAVNRLLGERSGRPTTRFSLDFATGDEPSWLEDLINQREEFRTGTTELGSDLEGELEFPLAVAVLVPAHGNFALDAGLSSIEAFVSLACFLNKVVKEESVAQPRPRYWEDQGPDQRDIDDEAETILEAVVWHQDNNGVSNRRTVTAVDSVTSLSLEEIAGSETGYALELLAIGVSQSFGPECRLTRSSIYLNSGTPVGQAMCIEALTRSDDRSDLTRQFIRRSAVLAAYSGARIGHSYRELSSQARRLYEARSRLVHEGYSLTNARFFEKLPHDLHEACTLGFVRLLTDLRRDRPMVSDTEYIDELERLAEEFDHSEP